MLLAELKNEAARLASGEQRELIAFLVALQTEQDDRFKAKLATKIDDRDAAHWMELNDVRKRYAE
jgi:hypothetical protein